MRRTAERCAIVVVSMLVLAAYFAAEDSLAIIDEEGEYVYYGYVPPTSLSLFPSDHNRSVEVYTDLASINMSTWQPPRIDIIGINDTTHVEIYNLTDKTLMESLVVNRMQLHSLVLPNETYFKVVSDKIVAVGLSGGGRPKWSNTLSGGFVVFYPSTDGGFSGREFIFKAMPSSWEPTIYVVERDVYHVFGVETSHVTIYDAHQDRVGEVDVQANSFKSVPLTSGEVYRVTSTGRILIEGAAMETFKYLPSLTGGFVGQHFEGTVQNVAASGNFVSMMVIAQEESEVSIYDMSKPSWLISLSGPDLKKRLAAGESWFISSTLAGKPVRIESTGDVTVLMGRGGWYWGTPGQLNITLPYNLGDDISFIGATPGQTLSFYAPTEAIIFATQDVSITIDGVPTMMKKDERQNIFSGQHTVSANATVIVEILGSANIWSAAHQRIGFDNWGTYIMPSQGLRVSYAPPPPIGGLGELVIYISVGAAVTVMILALLLFRRRKRPLKQL